MAASKPGPPQRPLVHGLQDPHTPFPRIGDLVMVRLPFAITLGPPSIISPSALSGATQANYHPAIILKTNQSLGGHGFLWNLEVLLVLSFSTSSDPAGFVRSMRPEWQRCLLPLPVAAGIQRPPTPTDFGLELQIPGYYSKRKSWLLIKPISVPMGDNSAYKFFVPSASMSANEINRVLAVPPIPVNLPTPPLPPDPSTDAAGTTSGSGFNNNTGTPSLPAPAPDATLQGNSGQSSHSSGYQKHTFDDFGSVPVIEAADIPDDDDDDDEDPRYEISLEFLENLFAPTSEYFAKLQRDRKEEKRAGVQQWVDCL